MSDNRTLTLGSRLRGGVSWAFAKFQSLPPLVTLPAIGLAAWLATPYIVKLAQGHSVEVADAGDGTGGATDAPRSDPDTQAPGSVPGAAAPAGTGAPADFLARPITPSTIPTWLPLPAPAPASLVSQPAPPRQTVQRPAAPAPWPKATGGRLIAPLPQQHGAERQFGGGYQRRPAESLMQSFNAFRTGRSAAIGNGLVPRGQVSGGQPWHMGGGYVARGSYGGGYRSFGTGGFGGGMRGGGGYGGGRGGGRR